YVLGEFADLSAVSDLRRPIIKVEETGEEVVKTAADQIAVIGTLTSGATASIHVREAVAGGIGCLWEINGRGGTPRMTADATFPELPIPPPAAGWLLIEVRAFGLNRSELHTRQGLASGVTFPRVLGIEAAGVVAQSPGGEFAVGQQVVTMMGGMGRTFDGGYAEYTCVPASQVIPFASHLPWATVGAVPEMLQTAYGSLT